MEQKKEQQDRPTEQSEGADEAVLGEVQSLSIKFSHAYLKLHTEHGIPKEAQLLECPTVDLEGLSREFLDYDTDEGTYVFPEKKGRYLMLIFKTESGHVFTTLRKQTDKTIQKYYRNRGEWFDIEVMYKDSII